MRTEVADNLFLFFYILDLIMNKIHSWKYIPDYNLGFSIGLDALRRYGYLKLLCALPNYFVCLVMLHCIPDLLLMTFFLVCLKKNEGRWMSLVWYMKQVSMIWCFRLQLDVRGVLNVDGVCLGRARLADVPQACLQSRAHDVGVWARRALPLLRVCLLDPPQHRPSLHSSVSISRLRVDHLHCYCDYTGYTTKGYYN